MQVLVKNDTSLLDEFIFEVGYYIRTSSNQKQLVERISAHLERLLERRDQNWLPEKYKQPIAGQAYSQYPLYVAPDGSYCITAVSFAPGSSTAVHDHRIWGVVGIYQGMEEQEFYKFDEQRKLYKAGYMLSLPGDCSYLLPPHEEIHSVSNPGERPSVSIHVYGADITKIARHSYNLETGTISITYSSYENI